MDGLINLYKPPGLTSARALDRVRRATGQRRSGHAGTLDPAAEGVLLILLGRATKLAERLMDLPKVYRATARLDCTSGSFDSESAVEPVTVAERPELPALQEVMGRFEGTIVQVPPAVSALKVAGRPAYRLARAGRPPELPPRPVQIYWLHVWRYAWPEVEFEVACGRGTYIRALIRDLGAALHTGGCLTGLVRRAVGPFQVEQSTTVAQLDAGAGDALVPLARVQDLLAAPIAVPARPSAPPGSV